MKPLTANPSELGPKVTMLSVLFSIWPHCLELVSHGEQTEHQERTDRAWLPLAAVVATEACVTLYTDGGEPPVSCRGGGRPAWLSREQRSSGSCLGLGCEGQATTWAFRVPDLLVSLLASLGGCFSPFILPGRVVTGPGKGCAVFPDSELCVVLVDRLTDGVLGESAGSRKLCLPRLKRTREHCKLLASFHGLPRKVGCGLWVGWGVHLVSWGSLF